MGKEKNIALYLPSTLVRGNILFHIILHVCICASIKLKPRNINLLYMACVYSSSSYSGTSHNGLSEIWTASMQWTNNVPLADLP